MNTLLITLWIVKPIMPNDKIYQQTQEENGTSVGETLWFTKSNDSGTC